jgi:hypothetical protein
VIDFIAAAHLHTEALALMRGPRVRVCSSAGGMLRVHEWAARLRMKGCGRTFLLSPPCGERTAAP